MMKSLDSGLLTAFFYGKRIKANQRKVDVSGLRVICGRTGEEIPGVLMVRRAPSTVKRLVYDEEGRALYDDKRKRYVYVTEYRPFTLVDTLTREAVDSAGYSVREYDAGTYEQQKEGPASAAESVSE